MTQPWWRCCAPSGWWCREATRRCTPATRCVVLSTTDAEDDVRRILIGDHGVGGSIQATSV
ncbi:MAG: hypothetical protein WKF58_16535 [Ilumatobacteraceae bacterium]